MFSWFPFLTYAVVTTSTPGPNTLMSMSNGTQLGFRRALPFNFGILAGFSLVMVLCTLLCSTLSAMLPVVKKPMLVIGAAYLLYLAWRTWRRSGVADTAAVHSGFLSGFLLQFINPKIYIYCIVAMEGYVLPVYAGQPVALLLFALLLAVIGFSFTLCWSAFGSLLRQLFSTHARVINTCMALALVWCAAKLFR